ncbi:MAG: PspC domain-containing protein [Chitinophagaceae bacterium]|nr:PspC domain-containing protein [Chitinophagaceae bacterium]MBP7107761.1 PspC domain-containing protein [Chitinophagaceae bacterium]MBP7314370.1 PspC domain-containing protein [Chitinophagaceae bacterium]HQX95984.1 PspC domain-containing protein [Chitinophagaceae bacterium]HQZ50195.1 PspC domain-containing protein [Chitinophagaceae bacterium]
MKKIININLSGRVIPIEDSAYEKLQNYIESLRKYFANEEGRDEIINDIESRIAELLDEKIRKGASTATEADVEEIITSMGKVEDFEAEEVAEAKDSNQQSGQQGNQQSQNYSYTEKKSRGRLYRDSSDKFIGGVCSGIAAYMNVDPAIVRILFAIITFGGFGLGFLAYIILWIILPTKDLDGYSGKRLYRNPDDKMLGGVAGGLAAYFDKSARTIRLIFAAPLVLSILLNIINNVSWHNDFDLALNIGFGSISGTFILIYVVLWMVLPEANTTYEKMEMRGEKVDVNRIRQNVQEGMGNFKEKVKGWGEEVKESAQNFSNKAKEFSRTKGKEFASDVNDTVRRSGGGLGHIIGVLFKVFFLFIAGTIAFGLFVGLIAFLFGGIAWWPINNFLWTSNWQQIYAWGTLIFFLVVPLVGFIIWVIRRITKVKSRSNYLGWTFGALWTIGWISAILLASSISRDFRNYDHTDKVIEVVQPVNNKMIVAVSEPELLYSGRFSWINDEGDGWDLSDDTLRLSTVKFTVKPSLDSQYHVTLIKHSFGRSEEGAIARAERIQYNILSRDSVLDVGSGYTVDKESKFRGQQVEVEIQVPIGKQIRFDESVNDKLNSLNVRVKRGSRRNRVVDVEIDDRSSRFRSGIDYTMGINGKLKTETGEVIESKPDNEYRYPVTDSVDKKNNIQKLIEEEERKKEESDRKIKELKKEIKPEAIVPSENIDIKNVEGAIAGGLSPVSSLVQWF